MALSCGANSGVQVPVGTGWRLVTLSYGENFCGEYSPPQKLGTVTWVQKVDNILYTSISIF